MYLLWLFPHSKAFRATCHSIKVKTPMQNFSRSVLDVSEGVLLAAVLDKRYKNYVGLRYEKIAV
jgi:hypothetical protein